MSQAPWWNTDPAQSDMKANTPDPTKYHAPDERQQALIGRGATAATMIARSDSNGASLGFDPTKPGVVHVDPDAPGGGTVVDFGKLTPQAVKSAVASAKPGDRKVMAYNVLASLGSAPAPDSIPQALESAQTPPAASPAPAQARARGRHAAAPVPESPVVEEPRMPVPVSPVVAPDNQAAMFGEFMKMMMNMIPRQVQTAPVPVAAPAQQVEVRPVIVEAPAPAPAKDSKLGIPFLTGGPVKPTEQVVFQLGAVAGALSTRYHAVINGEGCLVLVYDTRWEDGVQWVPPVMGDTPIRLTFGADRQSFEVLSAGVTMSLGCLDFVILLKVTP